MRRVALALVLLLGFAQAAIAAWPNTSTTNLPICTPNWYQQEMQAVADGSGGVIIVWRDIQTDFGNIYAQHVLASGAVDPLWPSTGAQVCVALNQQSAPMLVADGAGGAIITWLDQRADGASNRVYAQHVLADGTMDPAWFPNGHAVCSAGGIQDQQQIVTDGAGGAIIAWSDTRNGLNRDIYAAHITSAGVLHAAWGVNGRAVCTAANNQKEVSMIADGAGGAFIAWSDDRSGDDDIYVHHVLGTGALDANNWSVNGRWATGATANQNKPVLARDNAGGVYVCWQDGRVATATDIYATHVLATGERDPIWPYAEQAVCAAAQNQVSPQVVPDGAGGFYALWEDFRASGVLGDSKVYLTRMNAYGTVESGWAADGLEVCSAAILQIHPTLAADGAGGAWVVWADQRSVSQVGRDLYALRITAAGTIAEGWPSAGRALSTAAREQHYPRIVTDNAGSCIAVWLDGRRGQAAEDFYGQRVDGFGFLGNAEPVIAGVRDVPWDQGGHVKVTWTASYLDAQRDASLAAYDVLRASPGKKAGGANSVTLGAAGVAPRPGDIVAVPQSGTTTYWEYLTSLPALHYVGNYAYVAPTTSDSLAVANPTTAFMVVGRSATGAMYWPSAVVSGYSVDNLPPGTPAPFTGRFAAGATRLHWQPNTEADLSGYRLYRGATPSFTIDAASLVAAVSDTGYTATGDPAYFKLTAVDAHGNESAVALLAPNAISAVEGGARPVFMFAAPAPNPMSGATTLAFSLAQSGPVQLVVHDLAGRRVRTIINGSLAAGAHQERWDLRDDAGHRVGAGMYVARLVTAEGARTQRMVVVP